ncbi:MAG: FAD-dependent oxidoreductase [Pseudomonadota bacterium]
MTRHARVVVIGGGNVGTSVLYHLAREGWTDCILLEKAELTSGATWHAAGLVSRMVGGHSLGTMHDYAVELYERIEEETEQSVSWHGCGSLRVASSEHHRDWLMHTRDGVLARGQECRWVEPGEIKRLNPLYEVSDLIGGIYTPGDGHVDPSGTCHAMAKGARLLGAEIIRHNRVTDIRQLPSGNWLVLNEGEPIVAEHVVNAGGYHARQIGAFSGLDLPIVPMQHHYAVTDDVPEFEEMGHEIPVTRDDYYTGYLRREQKGALIGLYDTHDGLAKWRDGCPWDSENELFEPDYERITPWLEKCFERCPCLESLGLKRIVNGAICYTPDGAPLVGPAPGLQNHWLACGVTVGIAWGPGIGKYLAQWIVHGSADISMRGFDPRRFGVWADEEYAYRRCRENYMTRLSLHFPQEQYETCRDIRLSGAHERTAGAGALYEEAGGWERPRLYAPEEPEGWRRTSTFDVIREECRAVRERVGLADLTAFAKFEISGPGAEAFLDAVCANRVSRKLGGTCLTLLLNRRGTIEGEATIARTGEKSFYFVTGAPSERRVWDWLTLHCGVPLEDASISNKSDEVGILGLVGPRARDVLAACTSDDVSSDAFPWLGAREVSISGISCLALRLSFAGELGYELHAPNERLGELWDALMEAGEPHGIVPFGTKALDSLRLEKFYRGGHELANDASHKDVDQMRFARLDKEFVGKKAMLAREPRSRIALLALAEEETDALGGEAIYHAGKLVGSVTSAGFGYTVGKSLVIGFLAEEVRVPGTEVEISILGRRTSAVVLAEAPHDPANERLKV